MKEKPFIETNISNNIYIREFYQNTDSHDFIWHRDKEDRIIKSIDKTDWLIQIDDELPRSINEDVFIKKETYHRLIKGTGDLKIYLTKIIS